jgi:tRNA-dihydrouridine synthase A
MRGFIEVVADAGCQTFIVHARKAWLQGLSPKENREIPPLHYDWVYRLKQELPELEIIINGGIDSIAACTEHLQHVDGVMIGRGAYQNPYMLAAVDTSLFDRKTVVQSREAIVEALLPYIEEKLAGGAQLNHVTRHILGLFQGVPGARKFRRHLSENAYKPGAGLAVLEDALEQVRSTQERMAV